MPPWLNHPHTAYVLAAYSVAGFGLLGLLLCSWRSWRQRKASWQGLKAESRARRR